MTKNKDAKTCEGGEHSVVDGFICFGLGVTHVDAVVYSGDHDDDESKKVHDRERA